MTLFITFIGKNELLIRKARVYMDDHGVVFVLNGLDACKGCAGRGLACGGGLEEV